MMRFVETFNNKAEACEFYRILHVFERKGLIRRFVGKSGKSVIYHVLNHDRSLSCHVSHLGDGAVMVSVINKSTGDKLIETDFRPSAAIPSVGFFVPCSECQTTGLCSESCSGGDYDKPARRMRLALMAAAYRTHCPGCDL